MKTLIHLTSGDAVHVGHAIRCANLLCGHEELRHEDATLLPHRWGVEAMTPDSPFAEGIRDILGRDVTVHGGRHLLRHA